MDIPLFRDAKLKIKRANQHIEELRGLLNAFLQTDFYRLNVQTNTEIGRTMVIFEQTEAVPEDIQTILGDAMQNLRSVLDYMLTEILTRAGGPTGRVKFPAWGDAKAVKTALTNGQMKAAGADIIDLIVDVVQPYPGGNGADIAVLHSLNVVDKHLHLTPVVAFAGMTNVSFRTRRATVRNATFMGQGPIMSMISVPGLLILDGDPKPMVKVVFGQGDVFEGQAIIPTLEQLSKLVAGTLQAVEQVYLARSPGGAHTPPPSPDAPPPPSA
jgi:hypothetical protein